MTQQSRLSGLLSFWTFAVCSFTFSFVPIAHVESCVLVSSIALGLLTRTFWFPHDTFVAFDTEILVQFCRPLTSHSLPLLQLRRRQQSGSVRRNKTIPNCCLGKDTCAIHQVPSKRNLTLLAKMSVFVVGQSFLHVGVVWLFSLSPASSCVVLHLVVLSLRPTVVLLLFLVCFGDVFLSSNFHCFSVLPVIHRLRPWCAHH